MKTYPGADCNSDHNPVVATLQIKLKRVERKRKKEMYDISAFRNQQIQERYAVSVTNQFQILTGDVTEDQPQEQDDAVNQAWDTFKTCIQEATKEVIPKTKLEKRQKWMSDEILNLMKERKHVKISNQVEYTRLDKEIKRKCIEAKQQWMTERCTEIENLEKSHNYRRMYSKVKQVAGQSRKSGTGIIKDNQGNILFDLDDVIARWAEYIEELFADDRNDNRPHLADPLEGDSILISEVEHALNKLGKGKAMGPDDISAEMLAASGEVGLRKLTELCNLIYDSGIIPGDMVRSTFIALPKKPRAVECKDHRTISLMSHVMRVILKVIHSRIERKIDEQIAEEQYGFRSGRGTREAIFNLRIITERAMEVNQDIYLCFIDYEKAFDKVRHEDLMQMLIDIGLDGKDLRVIRNLYWDQEAAIRLGGKLSEWKAIKRGVRQGCVLSPCLFGLYSEIILRSIGDIKGIVVGGRNVNNIRYADDTVLLADNEANLQEMLDVANRSGETKGLRINAAKTKCMVISRDQACPVMNLKVGDRSIDNVNEFIYLGSLITNDGRSDTEVRRRIAIAKTSFLKMRRLLSNRQINRRLRYRMIKCYIWSTFLYGSELWTLSNTTIRKIEALEMWLLRRMLNISYTEHRTNEEVLRAAGTERLLLKKIKSAKIRYFGHIARHTSLQKDILTGKIAGRKPRGRPRYKWSDNVKNWTTCGETSIFHAAQDRTRWRMMAANPRREEGT